MTTFLRHAAAPTLALVLLGVQAFGQEYNQTNLVANTSGMGAAAIDSSLVNPWGLSRSSGSPWWVADNATGVATLYSGTGTKSSLTVTIPSATSGQPGLPTGTIYNGSATDFLLGAKPANFLFCTIDGLIVAWNSTAGATVVVKTTDGSSYTGLTATMINGQRYLYAANFTKGRVDVYNNAFQPVKLGKDKDDSGPWAGRFDWDDDPFVDRWLPRDFVPFNVQTIGNDVVVAYALHEDGNPFETDGPGLGYVDIFTAEGHLITRLEHGDWLNAPWGVALAPLDFGAYSHDLLIASFAGGGTTQSSGYIAAYDIATGKFVGLLEDPNGNPLAVNGVWAISPGSNSTNNYDSASAPANELYFAAGPNHGAGGLFGYISPVTTQQIEGNDQ